ncbi:hypothetical protein BST61_g433 [Cercospora zeina]
MPVALSLYKKGLVCKVTVLDLFTLGGSARGLLILRKVLAKKHSGPLRNNLDNPALEVREITVCTLLAVIALAGPPSLRATLT